MGQGGPSRDCEGAAGRSAAPAAAALDAAGPAADASSGADGSPAAAGPAGAGLFPGRAHDPAAAPAATCRPLPLSSPRRRPRRRRSILRRARRRAPPLPGAPPAGRAGSRRPARRRAAGQAHPRHRDRHQRRPRHHRHQASSAEHLALDAWGIGKLISINLGASRIVGMVYEMKVESGDLAQGLESTLIIQVELVGEVFRDRGQAPQVPPRHRQLSLARRAGPPDPQRRPARRLRPRRSPGRRDRPRLAGRDDPGHGQLRRHAEQAFRRRRHHGRRQVERSVAPRPQGGRGKAGAPRAGPRSAQRICSCLPRPVDHARRQFAGPAGLALPLRRAHRRHLPRTARSGRGGRPPARTHPARESRSSPPTAR